MAKFCGKCGSKLDEYTGICPLCNVKDNRNADKNELTEYIVTKKRQELKEQQISKENLLLKKKNHSIKVTIVVIAVILLAAVTTVILNSIGVIYIFPEENMDNEVYRDKMIDALMNHQDEWLISPQEDDGISRAYAYFTDLDFDGKLEFMVIQDYYDYSDSRAFAYRFDGNGIRPIECYDGFLNSTYLFPAISYYYDENTQETIILGEAFIENENYEQIGEFQLLYQNHKIQIEYYRMCEESLATGEISYYLFDKKGEEYSVSEDEWVQVDRKQSCKELSQTGSTVRFSESEIKAYDLKWAYDSYGLNEISHVDEKLETTMESPGETPTVKYYTVTFMNFDGSVISTQTVEEGHAAIAPELPEIPLDEDFGFKVVGWSGDYSNVTSSMIIYPDVKPVSG